MEKKKIDVDMVIIDNNDLITRAGTENKIKTPIFHKFTIFSL